MTPQVWIPWSGTSMQQHDSRCETLGSVLFKMVITSLSQDSPTPMLIFFPHNWTKPSWEILSRLYRVCDQQSRSWITKLIGTQPQHPKNQVHSQNNCTYALNASLNSKQTALGESQFVSAVEINIS